MELQQYRDLFDLTGKVCIVTGGAGYLGSESVNILKAFGGTVVAAVRDAAGKEKAPGAPEADLFAECDMTSTESVKACFASVAERYGRIDVLVNCACFGAGYGLGSQLEYTDDETWQKGLEGSVGVVFRGLREVIPYMKEHGGSIINYSSMYGHVAPDLRIYGDNPQKQPANYGAGKAAIAQLTRYAASALGEYGIRVNSVTPGPFPAPKTRPTLPSTRSSPGRPCWDGSARATRSQARSSFWLPMPPAS